MQVNPLKLNKPLQIIGLMVGLSEAGFALLATFADIGKISTTFFWAFIALPFFVVGLFYIVLFFRPNNLYGPADFENQEHFLKLQGRVKEIENNPFIQFASLDEPAIRLFLSAYRDDEKSKEQKWNELVEKFSENILSNSLSRLIEINWLSKNKDYYSKTHEGEDAHKILKHFVYGRLG
ncbi:hypothetical protein KAR28_01455 [Candidatus Parcubacteria bacterium]|nr:hypothetical protein [Candidatus Parcubacteria bacterium]